MSGSNQVTVNRYLAVSGARMVAISSVLDERLRQHELKAAGRFPHTLSDPEMTDANRLAAVIEEIGEVARAMMERSGAVNDKHGVELRKELVQVAALCVAWVEYLDAEKP